MISELLPPPIETAEAFGDFEPLPQLFPQEAALVERAVAKRRGEFATVRACAREALARLGHEPVPILPGERGAPRWPDGLVGSMTHCQGYRAAALARATDMATVGVDAEPNGPLPGNGVTETVLRPTERAHVAQLAADRSDVHWGRLIFSAKESVYKAWFPLTHRWLQFEEAEIRIDPAAGTFRAQLLVPGPEVAGTRLPGFDGRWMVRAGLIVTAIAVPRLLPATPPAAPRAASESAAPGRVGISGKGQPIRH
ncbi:4'-phosphopantetheinyl transferase family protein [Streptomyces lydicus]|uniref:4'-phosphopantetheinyl transferase family protein n=1 Tax=Streptomyces lydicus TaxID=47763 RepID=UPI001010B6AC|nr:4'-phosphopantetheinyl transferase superfamily protein [Streptomyces lydicus]MCZ1006306.1 4'-phosphopantetheinyl transferase superfamily protein [Streptomyces lydicus]